MKKTTIAMASLILSLVVILNNASLFFASLLQKVFTFQLKLI